MKGNFLSVWVCWEVIIMINWLQNSFMQVAEVSLPTLVLTTIEGKGTNKKNKKNKKVTTIL